MKVCESIEQPKSSTRPDFPINLTQLYIYNCLSPDQWGDRLPQRSSFAGAYPQTVQDYVLQNWQAYGFARSIAVSDLVNRQ